MGRHAREDADFFPFFVKDGRTLTVLQHKFGLQGIGFFTNLMRLLTTTPGHHLRLTDEADRLFVFSKIGCDAEAAEEMISAMVITGKIHARLWKEARVIFSEALCESLEELYSKRKAAAPTAAELEARYLDENDNNRPGNDDNRAEIGKSGADMPQSRAEKSIAEQSRADDSPAAVAVDPEFQSWLLAQLQLNRSVRNPGGLQRAIIRAPSDPQYRHFFAEYLEQRPRPRDPPPPPPQVCPECGGEVRSLAMQSAVIDEAFCAHCDIAWHLRGQDWVRDGPTEQAVEGVG